MPQKRTWRSGPTTSGTPLPRARSTSPRVGRRAASDGIRAVGELARMVALRPHGASERARGIRPCPKAAQNMAEVAPRAPAEVPPGARVDIDAVDARKHLPAPAGVLRLVLGDPPLDHRWCVDPQVSDVVRLERRGRADDVAREADRRSAFDREPVGVDDVLELDP